MILNPIQRRFDALGCQVAKELRFSEETIYPQDTHKQRYAFVFSPYVCTAGHPNLQRLIFHDPFYKER